MSAQARITALLVAMNGVIENEDLPEESLDMLSLIRERTEDVMQDEMVLMRKLLAEHKAKKVAEASAAEKEMKRLAEESDWKLSVSYAKEEEVFLVAKKEWEEFASKNPHKKTVGAVGKQRVSAEENPEKRAALDKRYAANNGDEVSKKNLFCKNGDGDNGTKEFKAGGKKINGCKYCCRSEATMKKHEEKCKK